MKLKVHLFNKILNYILTHVVFTLVVFCLLVGACKSTDMEIDVMAKDNNIAILQEGRALSEKYCQSCHLYAEPGLLPKHIWENEVLPRMGAFHGFYEKESRNVLMESGDARKLLLAANVFPETPIIDSMDWIKIKNYIIQSAPEQLIGTPVDLEVKPLFQIRTPKARISPPMSTMMQYDSQSGLIYHGDVKNDYSTINIFDKQLAPVQSLAMQSPAVSVREKDGELWALLMGSFISTDTPSGRIIKMSKIDGSVQYNKLDNILVGLQRPVDMAFADFDNDGDEDIVVAQFGNWAGRLEWFENKGEGNYQRHLLIDKTGATKVIVEDLNDNGLIDMMAMISQGDEAVYALINQGNGQFQQKKLLQVPPTYGSVTFEYVDIDNDGIKDIVHVAGDNADYEAILKPYHGIRIFKGLGDLNFEEVYFFALNGAYKALPIDFDGDGDLDIAVISFFPDYSESAKESLIILENTSSNDSLSFAAYTLPGYNLGRWNVMDTGDFNNDSLQDLVVGSFVVRDPYGGQPGKISKVMETSPMFMLLESGKK